MNRQSVFEALLRYDALGTSDRPLGQALSAAAEARRLRGAYERFITIASYEIDAVDMSRADLPAAAAFHPL